MVSKAMNEHQRGRWNLSARGWQSIPLGVLVLAATLGLPATLQGERAVGSSRPNILVLVADDQNRLLFNRQLMPTVFSELVAKGVQFNQAYVNTSLCCPSRAQILTGLYQHHTGVDDNHIALNRPSIVEALHDAGYRTGLAGKYLNSTNCSPKSGYDRWVCQKMDLGALYVDPILNVDGVQGQHLGYTTDVLATFLASFISSTPPGQPFFGIYTPISPHLPGKDARCNQPVPNYRPPSFDEDVTTHGKPSYLQQTPMTGGQITTADSDHRAMTRATSCLDAAVGTILSALGDREQDTIVFYVSDNGFLFGEHRWRGKSVPYEESTHVPFVVRYPALVPETAPFKSKALVQNVDVAPTVAELAGIQWGADGVSLVPLLARTATTVRTAALLEYCMGVSYPCLEPRPGEEGYFVPSLSGVVGGRYKYIEYVTGEKELYDLMADQYELVNRAGEPALAAAQAKLATTLQQLMARPSVETTIVAGPPVDAAPGTYPVTYFSQSRLATYLCRLTVNGAPGSWYPCNGQATSVTASSPGSYTFEVQGVDEGGQSDPTPAQRTFQVS